MAVSFAACNCNRAHTIKRCCCVSIFFFKILNERLTHLNAIAVSLKFLAQVICLITSTELTGGLKVILFSNKLLKYKPSQVCYHIFNQEGPSAQYTTILVEHNMPGVYIIFVKVLTNPKMKRELKAGFSSTNTH